MITPSEIRAFVQRIREAHEYFTGRIQPKIEQLYTIGSGLTEEVQRRQIELGLEAHARKYLTDPFLEALGWTVSTAETAIVETPIQRTGQGRRFMDYYGFERENLEPLLVIEAKRLSAQLPKTREGYEELPPNMRLAKALADFKSGGIENIKLGGDWPRWIVSLHDYVKGIQERHGKIPERVAITNGDWLVILENPADVFFSVGYPAYDKIHIFQNIDDIIRNAHTICGLLSYSVLSLYIPSQHPSALTSYVNGLDEITCIHALRVSYDGIGREHRAIPRLSVALALMVRSSHGIWVLCEKSEYPRHFFELPNDRDDLLRRLQEIDTSAQEFLAEVRHELNKPMRLLSCAEYLQNGGNDVWRELSDDYFLLETGQLSSFLSMNGDYDACPFHNWLRCREEGNAVGDRPMFSPSLNPRAYFPSGNPFHCAHIKVHNLRSTRCKVQGFETFLCCRRCIYFELCWKDDEAQLPCRKS